MYNRQSPCVYDNIKVVFHGIPKNASTSIKHLLYQANWNKKFEGPGQWIHKGNKKGGSIYPPLAEIKSDKYFNYSHVTVVRNPYDRFISFYTDLCLGSTNLRNQSPPFFVDNNLNITTYSVDEAINMVCSFDEDDLIDEHIASQSSFIHTEDVNIIKMEDISNDWKLYCNKINIEFNEIPVYNKSLSKVNLSEIQKEKLFKRYKKDFERFKYE